MSRTFSERLMRNQLTSSVYGKYVNSVEIGNSFYYLGRYFDFEMTCNEHKKWLTKELHGQLEAVNKLPLNPKNKRLIHQHYILLKISWHLTITELNITWVKQNLNNLVNSKFRYWLEIPISLTLDIISLSHKKYRLNNQKSSTKFKQSQVSFRLCLRNSKTPTSGNCSKKLAKQLTIQKYLESNKNCKIIYQTSNWK